MDEMNDYQFALLLQMEYDTENSLRVDDLDSQDQSDRKTLNDLENSLPKGFSIPVTPPPKKQQSTKSVMKPSKEKVSIIDPSWELLDPIPDIRALFMQYNATFFWSKLDSAEVRWSPRMTLCAGLCVYQPRGGFCSIRLSAPLLKLRPRKDLVETLLHEMIHAFLFLTHNNKDHDDHGPEFKKHMNRINDSEGTGISVYHSFHDEVNSYRQHWWRCDGPCKDRKPFFGWVKRSMNRAPSARDTWWADHERTCGGKYIKVKEPEGYKKKGEKKKKDPNEPSTSGKNKSVPKAEPKPVNKDIRNFLSTDQKDTNSFPKPNSTDIETWTQTWAQKRNPQAAAPDLSHREKQTKSAKVIDNIGKGLSSNKNIKSATNFLNLTQSQGVGEGVGRAGNIHSVGKFLKGESTKDRDETSSVRTVATFSGSGQALGGGGSSQNAGPRSGCQGSRLLTMFGGTSSGAPIERGKKRPSDEHVSSDHNKRSKPNGIASAIANRNVNNNKTNSSNNGALGEKQKSTGKTISNGIISRGTSSAEPIVLSDSSPVCSGSNKSPQNDIRDYFTSPPRHKPSEASGPEMVPCPACSKTVPYASINDHLNTCLT